MHVPGSVRMGAAWLLAVPFLLLARPTPRVVLVGGAIASLGLLFRAWAAGTIDKDRDLATSGPYAHTRNPMYLGSFMIGLGLTLAGGAWLWPATFIAVFLAVYVPTMSREGRVLAERFGYRFAEYSASVPAFLPRPTPYRAASAPRVGFSWARYARYREWEALLGVVAVLAVLALKLRYFAQTSAR